MKLFTLFAIIWTSGHHQVLEVQRDLTEQQCQQRVDQYKTTKFDSLTILCKQQKDRSI